MIGAIWGIVGVCVILVRAIVRLVPPALAPLGQRQSTLVFAAYAASMLVNGYVEGYRAFHVGFSPRVAARALHLREDRSLLHAILAPIFVLAFFHTTRRRMMVRYFLVVGLAGLVWVIRHTPQPWRGAIDAGVVIALTWGMASLLFYFVRGLAGTPPPASAELPES